MIPTRTMSVNGTRKAGRSAVMLGSLINAKSSSSRIAPCRAAYEHHRSDGRLPVTIEVVHGHAWWPEHGPKRTAEGLDVIRVARPVRRV